MEMKVREAKVQLQTFLLLPNLHIGRHLGFLSDLFLSQGDCRGENPHLWVTLEYSVMKVLLQ